MTYSIPLAVHATHEAGAKVGGIGSVLDGILGTKSYNEQVGRTVLVGPMFGWDPVQMARLTDPLNGVRIRYSSLHGILYDVGEEVQQALRTVERTFHVGLLYGLRRFGDVEHEILLVDASNPHMGHVERFSYFLWENYGIESFRYNHDFEYNLYMSIAQPLFSGLKALGVDEGLAPHERVIIAHEWLGLPVAFAAQLNEPEQWRTVFYAHEVATARLLVESHAGHDTRFYNALLRARESHLPLDTVFGEQTSYFKHAIVRQAIHCDAIFAVSDTVREELRFLGGPFANCRIDLVYNGIRSEKIKVADLLDAKRRLQEYCRTLLGFKPDYVFTHVARMVLSKALWRDVRVASHLDRLLASSGKTAALFVLATSEPAGRQPEQVESWETLYGWPVGHRGDNGDLIGEEAPFFFDDVEPFNHSASNSKIVFVNQFGWSQDRCGRRMPADMTFSDIRRGSDLEFGQSIYEPFGISQIEPVQFGAISCVSSVCGLIGFVQQAASELVEQGILAAGEQDGRGGGRTALPGSGALGSAFADKTFPLVVADYIGLPEGQTPGTPRDALEIDGAARGSIEARSSEETARQIFERLPGSRREKTELRRRGSALAGRMSWETVVETSFLPGLARICKA
ncbi:MAG: hypothetical protein F4X14_09305 [Caldilineaceae bacterium SB0661_bin_32]|uniref:Glycosyltransferase family 4 protein n=1 Tax=Caldilineaceae bacterium SB0661_bin_32 TaxID=2605255 RepID=A0A6B1D6H6_9CHLR|nr:hypothetical protein [Caldilineaceae bacterium SB0661_bin_32]